MLILLIINNLNEKPITEHVRLFFDKDMLDTLIHSPSLIFLNLYDGFKEWIVFETI